MEAVMVTYLVTGGCGFIGSNFIHYLLRGQPDIDIVNVDALTYAGHLENISDLNTLPNYHFEKADIRCQDSMQAIFEKYSPQVVINFAAETHVDRSIQDPAVFIHTNVYGTQVLLEECRRRGTAKFIQISTDEVYGAARTGEFFDEEAPLKPGNPYSASKASADLLGLAYWNTYQLPVVISRCTNNYGPYQHPEKLIPLTIRRCLQGLSVPVYGDGQQERDWLFVEDHCAAVNALIDQGIPGCIYNIAGQSQLTNINVVKEIIKCLHRSACLEDSRRAVVQESLIQYVKDRPGHDRRYALNDTRMRQEIEWIPLTDFSAGIRETVDWYLANEAWLDQVNQEVE